MKKRSFFLLLCLLTLIQQLLPLATAAQTGNAKLIWADEFNTPGKPDATKWTYDTTRGCPNNCGWGNNELQYYTSRTENVVVEDGVLKIRARKESYGDAAYTSARLHSKGKFQVKYGTIEVRAKLPTGIGTWPAIWMLGGNIDAAGWPACGEIDIMEHRGREQDKIFGTFHFPGHSGDNSHGNARMVPNATSSFHVYKAEWSAKEIRILVDGQLVHSMPNNGNIPFNHEFFLLLNLAIGGNFAGPVDPSFNNGTMEIDYVRVYQ